MRYVLGFLVGFCFSAALASQTIPPCPPSKPSWWEKGWAVTVYSGPLTSQTTSQIVYNPDFEGSAIIAETVSKELVWFFEERLDFELETQLVEHFNGQTHLEINPFVLIARWKSFPWNHVVRTTMAIGDGLSIATQVPKYEESRRGIEDTSQVLNYVMAEVTLSLPSEPQWALIGRYHHRSGAFGLFNGVHDASTAFCAGLKYWF